MSTRIDGIMEIDPNKFRVKVYSSINNRAKFLNQKCNNSEEKLYLGIMSAIRKTFNIILCDFEFPEGCPENKLGIKIPSDWFTINEMGTTYDESTKYVRIRYAKSLFSELNEILSGLCFESCHIRLGQYNSITLPFDLTV